MPYDDVIRERDRLEQEIDFLEKRLSRLPKGKLICGGTQANPQFYQGIGERRIYLSQKDMALIDQLAEKKYDEAQLKDCRRQLRGVLAYLECNNPSLDTAPKLLHSSSKCSKPLARLFCPENTVMAQWAASSYIRNDKYPDKLKHDTINGLKVRSKAEAMIVMQLVIHQIPFHYEEELELENIRLYPDFTLRHPKTGATYYWEHFGCLDDDIYQKHVVQKLQLYMRNGILPSTNLIITWESGEQPLALSEIQYEIRKYFL